MNSTILTLLTIFGSASCAIIGILVNRHISLRQVKTAETGAVITNAEYWRKEVETFQEQITELRKQLEASKVREKERDRKIEEITKDLELMTFKYYQAMVERNNFSAELDQYRGPKSNRGPSPPSPDRDNT